MSFKSNQLNPEFEYLDSKGVSVKGVTRHRNSLGFYFYFLGFFCFKNFYEKRLTDHQIYERSLIKMKMINQTVTDAMT